VEERRGLDACLVVLGEHDGALLRARLGEPPENGAGGDAGAEEVDVAAEELARQMPPDHGGRDHVITSGALPERGQIRAPRAVTARGRACGRSAAARPDRAATSGDTRASTSRRRATDLARWASPS